MKKSILWLLSDTRKAAEEGTPAIMQRQNNRLAEIVEFARTNSRYYYELYKDLPDQIEDIRLLPVTSKKKLMPSFNDWVTDKNVTLEDVRNFVNNPDMIGELFLGKYTVATTSGTTGHRGIFLVDDHALSVNLVLTLRALGNWLGIGDFIKYLIHGGRMAVVAAEGHFLVSSGINRFRKKSMMLGSAMKLFSVHTPIPELVAQLNHFQPSIVIGYGSVISILASEQAEGRLRIKPILVEPAGESLPKKEYERISKLFNTKVRDLYGATECPFLSVDCKCGWYHVNSDWVIVEPVDTNYKPVQPGEQSHTVLLTNLANRVQPILRYDLGDSIMVRPDPCPCGNPHPAIRVEGRSADILIFLTEDGEEVAIPPLVIATLVDRTAGIRFFQIVQTTSTNLRVRLLTMNNDDSDFVWDQMETEIRNILNQYKLNHITIERAEEPPEQALGGKYRRIIPLKR
ncbi:hypothetical protein MUG84_12365 [Paenibacillus sp. KQZ6P-2]|uniref:CoF synthetase n=1 Tax=Paenibacillus mangrovi TaxID=2931978 RepID=A0A9X2B333_9BACL|nr:hypothetical protein [Paenibacillus mangrovi]MCJ8012525.1 hypothetical protein [Paenibacillus mangrovi]